VSGAEGGALAGLAFGPVGTTIGAFIGGSLGLFGGALAGAAVSGGAAYVVGGALGGTAAVFGGNYTSTWVANVSHREYVAANGHRILSKPTFESVGVGRHKLISWD
jgi:hypothetical protein